MTFSRTAAVIGGIFLLAAGGAAQTHAHEDDNPDAKEIRNYRLNMDVIQRFAPVFKTLNDDAAVKKCAGYTDRDNAKTLDEMAKNINDCPAALKNLGPSGFKPREFALITVALFGDFMAVSMKKNGMIKEYPDTISPENAAFLEQNYDKLQAMMATVNGKAK